RGLRRVSKPGCRIYTRRREIPWVKQGMGTVILSTPRGVLSGRQARRQGVGGEILCEVW
ncbi:MAG: 30S ribosomal protein S8, partial [Chloroflexi bacterium]|nr:30S ribosomal protein S8 [Chloroflexota bacterium]